MSSAVSNRLSLTPSQGRPMSSPPPAVQVTQLRVMVVLSHYQELEVRLLLWIALDVLAVNVVSVDVITLLAASLIQHTK